MKLLKPLVREALMFEEPTTTCAECAAEVKVTKLFLHQLWHRQLKEDMNKALQAYVKYQNTVGWRAE